MDPCLSGSGSGLDMSRFGVRCWGPMAAPAATAGDGFEAISWCLCCEGIAVEPIWCPEDDAKAEKSASLDRTEDPVELRDRQLPMLSLMSISSMYEGGRKVKYCRWVRKPYAWRSKGLSYLVLIDFRYHVIYITLSPFDLTIALIYEQTNEDWDQSKCTSFLSYFKHT